MIDVSDLRSLLAHRECEWIEFKHNDAEPTDVGEYLSALSNSAALHGQEAGWIVWGVEDGTRRLVGTDVDPRARKKGNEPVENWWAHLLEPRIDFSFHDVVDGGLRAVVLRVQAAPAFPVAFQGTEWIRIGSAKKKLADHPGRERELWAALGRRCFEEGLAKTGLRGGQVLELLDHRCLFRLLQQPVGIDGAAILARLAMEGLIVDRGGDGFDVSKLGAILFAHDLRQFGSLGRKTLRFVRYRGVHRGEAEHEQEFRKGYAAAFEEIVGYIAERSPRNEVLGQALRRELRMYPDVTLRELIGNALIHQDFSLTGTGPMVEMFEDRLEISNPGLPLIDVERFIDHSPRSRNERLAGLMRRLGICEERGSGFDKAMFALEVAQLPAPHVRTDATHTHVVLFAHRHPMDGDKAAQVRACYLHACLRFVSGAQLTNASVRERFGLGEKDHTIASRLIREAVLAKRIKPADPSSRSRKYARYLPFWA
ncbi:MAG: putative DNA binding domain-containing protein [Planctomycetes bacterium]|nr:putative DNA binding domain-containing protein [Planctomycetota bacterium]